MPILLAIVGTTVLAGGAWFGYKALAPQANSGGVNQGLQAPGGGLLAQAQAQVNQVANTVSNVADDASSIIDDASDAFGS